MRHGQNSMGSRWGRVYSAVGFQPACRTSFSNAAGIGADFELDRVCLNNPNLFVISGGPGSGKSTLIGELAKLGFQYAPEVARQIIQEQVQAGGRALPWDDREAYTRIMLQRSIESYLEHTPAREPVFSDRGIPDSLCYARLIGLRDESFIQSACRHYRYAPIVFLALPWKEIYETDNERKQDFAEAELTFQQMTEVYRDCGYQIAELPKTIPASRARFVLELLNFTAAS